MTFEEIILAKRLLNQLQMASGSNKPVTAETTEKARQLMDLCGYDQASHGSKTLFELLPICARLIKGHASSADVNARKVFMEENGITVGSTLYHNGVKKVVAKITPDLRLVCRPIESNSTKVIRPSILDPRWHYGHQPV